MDNQGQQHQDQPTVQIYDTMKAILSLLMAFSMLGTVLAADAPAPTPSRVINLLVITKTAGYRHQVIPTAIRTLVEIGQEAKWGVTATEDTSLVTPDFLAHFDVIVFLMTTKNIFTPEEKSAIEAFEGRQGPHHHPHGSRYRVRLAVVQSPAGRKVPWASTGAEGPACN